MRGRARYAFISLAWLLGTAAGIRAQEIVATTPMELQHNRPVVQVTINGKGPFHFVVDTGTGGDAVVSAELIEKLSLPTVGEDEVGDPTGANRHKVRAVGVRLLEFGGVQFKDVRATQLVEIHPGMEIDGILGFTLFRDYLLTIDFPAKQVRLERGSLPDADGNEIVAFRMPDSVPVIELNVAGKPVDAHVDTGGMGLSLPEKFAAGLVLASAPEVIGRGRTVSSDFEIKAAVLTADIRLGGYTFVKPFVEINPVFPIANLGAIPLRHFAVTFDQRKAVVRFSATEKTIEIAPPRRREGPPGA